jgi:endonuclease/exonuclease/phosphatase family metal-dependent hydrolase
MRLHVFFVLVIVACGGNHEIKPLSAPPDQITAITYNMYYGLAADLVPENLSKASLSATAVAIVNATTLTDFRCRIDAAAKRMVAENPDVIGLQEALLISYARELDDPSEDEALVDFIEELTEAIERAGGPHYHAFQRNNAFIEDTLPLFGGIRIGDRGAVLVHPRLAAKEVGSLTFSVLKPGSTLLPGTGGVVVRGALHVQVPFASGTLDFFNAHLQSGDDSAVREAQADELASWIRDNSAPNGTIILTADLNDVPTSPTVARLTANLVDTYAVAGVAPGFTAYQPQTLDNPTDQSYQRIDFILVRAGTVERSEVIFNEKAAPCNLWPSDHFGVVSGVRTAASPRRVPPSE